MGNLAGLDHKRLWEDPDHDGNASGNRPEKTRLLKIDQSGGESFSLSVLCLPDHKSMKE